MMLIEAIEKFIDAAMEVTGEPLEYISIPFRVREALMVEVGRDHTYTAEEVLDDPQTGQPRIPTKGPRGLSIKGCEIISLTGWNSE